MAYENKSFFEQIFCVRSKDNFFKLILFFNHKLLPSQEDLRKQDITHKVAYSIIIDIGWLHAACKENNILINEIEIIVPPFGEYLDLENRLRDLLIEKGVVLSLTIGLSMSIPKRNIGRISKHIDTQLKTLIKKDSGSN